MEGKETPIPNNPLSTVLQEMRQQNPDVGRLGEALFDLSKALIPTLAVDIEREESEWRIATGGVKSIQIWLAKLKHINRLS